MVSKRIPTAEAKAIVLDRLAAGDTRKAAMQRVGRSLETYKDWCKKDPDFKARVGSIRLAARDGGTDPMAVPDFPEFCERYLHKPLPLHQLRAWDVVSGRPPRDMHPSMTFQQGAFGGDCVILNFPPSHAKSTVWTVEYVVWRIHKNPNIRVAIVSKTEHMAKKFMSSIKFILTSPVYHELHAAFAPTGGWRDPTTTWREDQIYVRGRTSAEKDPTVQTLGIGSQIYGARLDLLILDDVQDFKNSGQFEAIGEWLSQDGFSRLEDDSGMNGQLLVVGTRVAPMDLYRHLRDNAVTIDDEPMYSYFAQPAILENPTGPKKDWVVLWPERLPPEKLAKKRAAFTDPRKFELVYQQNDVADDAPFPMAAVQASINRQRFNGPMRGDVPGHREYGMQGLHIVAGLDPATVGATACVVLGVDKITQKRWVLDAWNKRGATPQWTIDLIKRVTLDYKVREWRIERNAFQRFLTQLPEVKDWLHARGVLLREHTTTGSSKWDADWGVETLIPLFLTCVDLNPATGLYEPRPDRKDYMIDLPKATHSEAIGELVRQLQVWEPDQSKHLPSDLVMALWFAECGARQYLMGSTFTDTHLKAKFVSRAAKQARTTVTMDDLLAAGMLDGHFTD